ncbi:MAG TPA: hypothetical protein VE978_28745 [Chitinophagales bacterium]|nr:hypothetical protein [Chitinophagales bacterium]
MSSKFYQKIFLVIALIFLYDSIVFSQTTTKIETPDNEHYEWVYIVFAGTSLDFHALDSVCNKIAIVTSEKYSNKLVYDKQRGMIVPDSSDDELYAGDYSPRRYPEESISIEMLWYYFQNASLLSDSDKRMAIVTGIFENKSDAQENLKKIRPVVPDAYIKRIELYMGCMH